METGLIEERQGAVLRLRLHRPAVHNAFDAALIAALTQALAQAGRDDALRAVVLEAEGTSFSAGADLGWMQAQAQASQQDNQRDALALAALMRTLDTLPKPTIARVQGSAFGGGVGLVACCDIAIGVHGAKFGLTECRLGLLPAVISPYVVRAIGERQARRWFATGESFDAATALQQGLLHQVVEEDLLDASVQRQIELLLRAGPQAASMAKQLAGAAGRDVAAQEQDRDNADLIARLRASPEGREGIAAFLERRPPAWTR